MHREGLGAVHRKPPFSLTGTHGFDYNMGNVMKTLWGGIALALLAAAAVAQEPPAAKSSAHSKATFERVCSGCHKLDSATSSRRTREQWQDTIEAMISKQGAKIGDEEFGSILDYLVAAYGKVNVNKAPADEIVEVVGLSLKEAEAIVKYRQDNGGFENFDALGKVPGIDRNKLEKGREAIAF
jgi:competence protein ComEA